MKLVVLTTAMLLCAVLATTVTAAPSAKALFQLSLALGTFCTILFLSLHTQLQKYQTLCTVTSSYSLSIIATTKVCYSTSFVTFRNVTKLFTCKITTLSTTYVFHALPQLNNKLSVFDVVKRRSSVIVLLDHSASVYLDLT